MSINSLFLSGNVGKLNYRAAGQATKSGKVLSFPSLSAPIKLSDDQLMLAGQSVVLTDQTLWVDIGVPTVRGSQEADEARIFDLAEKIKHGHSYALVVGAMITEWGNPTRRSVKVPFNGFAVSAQPITPFNEVILKGRVIDYTNGLMIVEDSYNVKGVWKSRNIPVVGAEIGSRVNIKGADIFIKGRLAARSYSGNPDVYVIANDTYFL